MQVKIKDFSIAMALGNKGIELQVNEPSGKHLGDLVVTKSKLIWCKGQTKVENGIPVSWKKFIEYMES